MTGLEIFVVANPLLTYAFLFGGMFIEGELFFLMAAIFAWQGLLDWGWLILAIFSGVIIGDIAWYFLGRYARQTRLGFTLSKRFQTYDQWLDKNFMPRYFKMAFLSKFIAYVNRLTPIIAGWHGMALDRFAKIHFAAACLWVATVGIVTYIAGYFVGPEGIRWLIKRIEWVALGGVLFFIGGEYFLRKIFYKKIRRSISN